MKSSHKLLLNYIEYNVHGSKNGLLYDLTHFGAKIRPKSAPTHIIPVHEQGL